MPRVFDIAALRITHLGGRRTDAVAATEEPWHEAPQGGWSVELAWSEIDGRMECVGLAIVGDGSQPLTASALRKLPLGTMILERRRRDVDLTDHDQPDADYLVGTPADQPTPTKDEYAERIADSFTHPRKRYTDEEYQLVADVYDEAMRAGIPPTAHVQDKLRLRTRTQAGKLVARVRKTGLLPPTEQRVPKGNQ